MSKRKESCGSCRFWEQLPWGHQEEGESLCGDCRRFPPVLFDKQLTDEVDMQHLDTFWGFPVTLEIYWCGEWRPKQEGS